MKIMLNGIAYDADNDRLFVTGKNWNKTFEISLLKSNHKSNEVCNKIKKSLLEYVSLQKHSFMKRYSAFGTIFLFYY